MRIVITPAHAVETHTLDTISLEKLAKDSGLLDVIGRTGNASKERLESSLTLVVLGRESCDVERLLRLKEIGHVDCGVEGGCDYISTLLGLREVSMKS